jgi:hypothetical protein
LAGAHAVARESAHRYRNSIAGRGSHSYAFSDAGRRTESLPKSAGGYGNCNSVTNTVAYRESVATTGATVKGDDALVGL